MRTLIVLALLSLIAAAQTTPKPQATSKAQPFTVEYYYKAKWGHADEFIRLFKKNHLPLLQDDLKTGRALSVTAVQPVYHATEDGRWDYRVTIVYRDVLAAASAPDNEPLLKRLFPDRETYKKEEQRRFEILDAHWDLPIKPVDLNAP